MQYYCNFLAGQINLTILLAYCNFCDYFKKLQYHTAYCNYLQDPESYNISMHIGTIYYESVQYIYQCQNPIGYK